MKTSTSTFFQIILVLIGLAALTFMLWEPHLEGRNAHATTFEVYFHDPFLAYVYVGSIPFFVALYRAFTLFGQVRQTGAFSQATVDALRDIRRCAMVLLSFVMGGEVIILLCGDKEDRPAGLFMGLLAALVPCLIAVVATQFARRLRGTHPPNKNAEPG